ncbi:hypothetical protein, partial [Pontibacter rugosus]
FFLKTGNGAVITGRSALSQSSYQVFVHSMLCFNNTSFALYPNGSPMFYIFKVVFYTFFEALLCHRAAKCP